MFIPSCMVIWHGFAGMLGLHAQQQWAEAKTMAASYGVDITRAGHRHAAAPDADNVLAHPWLKPLITHETPGILEASLAFEKLVKPAFPTAPADLERSASVDFSTMVRLIQEQSPWLVEPSNTTNSPAAQILAATGKLGIPWQELDEAAGRLQSQFPPVGSLPVTDDFTAPANSHVLAPGLLHLGQLCRLRAHAALAAGQPEAAFAALRLLGRLADAYLDEPGLAGFVLGNHLNVQLLAIARAGTLSGSWTPAASDWIAGWAGRFDATALLVRAWRNELYFCFNEIQHLEHSPGASDRLFAAMADLVSEEAWSEVGLPFDQSWLSFLRGKSAWLYQNAPPAAFLLWQAANLKLGCQDHLRLLADGGLIEYAWPDEPRQKEPKFFSTEATAVNLLKNQSHARMLLIGQALQDWRGAHGDYPHGLEAVEKSLAPEICLDPFTYKLFPYERTGAKTYRLYSVGPDFVDNGGEPMTEEGEGDLNWHRGE